MAKHPQRKRTTDRRFVHLYEAPIRTVTFDEAGYLASGKKGSPCEFCSIHKERRGHWNLTCRGCGRRQEYAARISGAGHGYLMTRSDAGGCPVHLPAVA